MNMTLSQLIDVIIEVDTRAESLGMNSMEVALGFLTGALAIGDRNVSGGLSKDQFLRMAEKVYDKARGSLTVGRSA